MLAATMVRRRCDDAAMFIKPFASDVLFYQVKSHIYIYIYSQSLDVAVILKQVIKLIVSLFESLTAGAS